MKELTDEIIESLHNSDRKEMWEMFPEVLVWILFVAACGASDVVGRAWLLADLRVGMGVLGMGSISGLEELLKGLLYTECLQGPYLESIWKELCAGDSR